MTAFVPEPSRRRLRGRNSELEMVSHRLDALERGHGGVVLIRGPAGLGKSALLEQAERMALEHGLRVLRGAGAVAAQTIPLAPLLDALTDTEDPPVDARVLRELSGSQDQRYWLLRELEERLERAAQAGPVVIALDDLQWADAATLNAVGVLPRRLASHRILWLFVVRSGELPAPVHLAVGRIRVQDADILTLGRLDEAAISEVARDVLGGDPDARLRGVIDRVAGQPLWLVELLRGLRDEQLVSVDAGTARLIGDGIPRRLLESVGDQLARLSDRSREGLQMASVLGRRFSLDELAGLMNLSASALLDPVREALAAGLIVDDGDRLRFRHDLVRESIEAALPAAIKRSLQRRALDVVLEHGAPPSDVATLVMEVARPGDVHAIDLLRRATAEVGRVSPSVAAPLSRRLLELTPPTDPGWSARVVETVDLLVHSGQASEAERLIAESASRMSDHAAEAAARMTLGTIELQYGPSDCAEQCRLGLELPGLPAPLRVALLSLRACGLEMLGEVTAAADCAKSASAEAAALGDSFEAVATLPPRALVAFDLGDWRAAVDLADLAVRNRERADIPARRAWMFDAWKTLILVALGRLAEATQLIEAGTRIAEREGISANLRIWSMLRCRTMLGLGRFADAAAEAEAVMEMSDEIGEGGRGYINHVASSVLTSVAIHTGDAAGLRAARRAALNMSQVTEGRAVQLAAWMRARLAAAQGDHETIAKLEISDLDPLIHGVPNASSPRRYVDQPELARILLAAGRREDAIAVAERLAAAAEAQADFPFLQAVGRQATAIVHADPEAAEEALELLDGCQEPLLRAAALEDAGRLVPDSRATEAVDRLDAALDIYNEVGATRDAARLRGMLRRRGVRRPGSPSGASTNWPELSQSELAVVQLVAEGATNREVGEQLFLSPHTVNAHLRHVFSKLGIRSRVDLARIAAERATGAGGQASRR